MKANKCGVSQHNEKCEEKPSFEVVLFNAEGEEDTCHICDKHIALALGYLRQNRITVVSVKPLAERVVWI